MAGKKPNTKWLWNYKAPKESAEQYRKKHHIPSFWNTSDDGYVAKDEGVIYAGSKGFTSRGLGEDE